jgi:hypothetical protein
MDATKGHTHVPDGRVLHAQGLHASCCIMPLGQKARQLRIVPKGQNARQLLVRSCSAAHAGQHDENCLLAGLFWQCKQAAQREKTTKRKTTKRPLHSLVLQYCNKASDSVGWVNYCNNKISKGFAQPLYCSIKGV